MAARIAKLSPPRLAPGTLERERLYRQLDECCATSSCIWIGAGAGCGKTVLAASWARARQRALFWFDADVADASAGNLLHYLGQLLPVRRGARRPPLAFRPDGRVPLAALLRTFVRAFYQRLPDGAVLVIDNAERIPRGSEGASVLALLVEEIPAPLNLLVLSRDAPDAALARACVHGRVARIGHEALRLEPEETRALAASVSAAIDAAQTRRIHAWSDGWPAGARLLAGVPATALAGAGEVLGTASITLFDYIASELFERWPPETRQILISLGLLPTLSADSAAAVSGSPRAPRILDELARSNFFLARLPGTPPRYRLHPLLHQFLQSTAQAQLPADAFAALRRRSAAVLAASGEAAAAARHWMALADWDSLVRLIEAQGDQLLAEGRHGELLAWLDALPAGRARGEPLLALWRARALLAIAPAQGVEQLADLWPALEAGAPLHRLADAWEAVVCSHLFLRRPQRMADWSAAAQRLLDRIETTGDAALRTRVLAALFIGFAKIDPGRWPEGERAALAVAMDPHAPPDLRLVFGASLVHHWHWRARALPLPPQLFEGLRALVAEGRGSVHQRLVWDWVDAGTQLWFEPDESLARVRETIARARALQHEHGLREFGFVHFIPVVMAAHLGQPQAAAADAAALRAMPPPGEHTLFEQVPRLLALVSHHLHEGQLAPAQSAARAALEVAEAVRSPAMRVMARCAAARVRGRAGELGPAYVLLREALRIGRAQQMGAFSCAPWLAAAMLALQAGRTRAAVAFARRGFAVMAVHAVWRPPPPAVHGRAEFEQLCALAWRHGIERAWVATVAQGRGLQAPPGAGVGDWPWPLQIRTLGGLQVLREGQPLVWGRKAPRKVLELLQFLLAAGPRPVAAHQAVDALWPDEEGDAGHRAFLTALHRLRKLVGEAAVVHREGRVGLANGIVSVDRFTLEALLEGPLDDARLRAVHALALGDFLPDQEAPWAAGPRARLRARLERALARSSEPQPLRLATSNPLPIGDAA